jgi:hypothetical protein
MNQAAKRPAKSNGKARTVATVPAGDGSSVILVANPRKSPWPRFDHLAVDIGAALGLRDWVAAFDERKQRWYVGQVEDLQQSFTINRRDNWRPRRSQQLVAALLWQGDRQAPQHSRCARKA